MASLPGPPKCVHKKQECAFQHHHCILLLQEANLLNFVKKARFVFKVLRTKDSEKS